MEVFDEEAGVVLTVIYRDDRRFAWAKKVHIKSFIRDKEYRLAKQGSRVDRVLVGESDGLVHLRYAPRKRQRLKEEWFDLSELEFSGAGARGRRIGTKPVQSIGLHRPS